MTLVIIPLGSTNDAAGTLDAESEPRLAHAVRRYNECRAAGRSCRVLPSGGADAAFAFNPTTTPHWEYVAEALLVAGLPESALVRPGLPALHTVDEAIMARRFVLDSRERGGDDAIDEVASKCCANVDSSASFKCTPPPSGDRHHL